MPREVSVYGQPSSTKPVELEGAWEGTVLSPVKWVRNEMLLRCPNRELGQVMGQGRVGDVGHKSIGIQLHWFCCAGSQFLISII